MPAESHPSRSLGQMYAESHPSQSLGQMPAESHPSQPIFFARLNPIRDLAPAAPAAMRGVRLACFTSRSGAAPHALAGCSHVSRHAPAVCALCAPMRDAMAACRGSSLGVQAMPWCRRTVSPPHAPGLPWRKNATTLWLACAASASSFLVCLVSFTLNSSSAIAVASAMTSAIAACSCVGPCTSRLDVPGCAGMCRAPSVGCYCSNSSSVSHGATHVGCRRTAHAACRTEYRATRCVTSPRP
jgi:hypothetical protein